MDALTVLAIAGVTAVVAAATPAGAEQQALKAAAVEHQEKADRLFVAGKYQAALKEALASHALYPTARTAINVALILRQMDRNEEAFEQLLEALDLEPGAADRELIVAQLAEVGQRLTPARSWLFITSEPAGAVITAASRAQPLGRTPRAIGLDPGPQQIGVALDGHEPATSCFDLPAGVGTTWSVRLVPRPELAASTTAAGVPTSGEESSRPSAVTAASPEPAVAAGPGTVNWMLWIGVGALAGGALIAVGGGVAALVADSQLADGSRHWLEREPIGESGLTWLAVAIAGVLLGGGGAVTAAVAGF
ncbi:MAG: hypothetical protein JXR83_19645 [Deltaproteobacteria bacterium]|nr:hypothetical protein [Deltaproteobacteria bacterium]